MSLVAGDRRWAWFLALLLLAWAPLILSPVPPLNDYPSLLARVHILANIGDSPLLQRYYDVGWLLVPRLAAELVALPLAQIVTAETALLIVAALTLAVLAGGVVAVHRALFGNVSPLPLAAFLLLYNRQFLWGTLSFLLTLGLSFWLFAGWIALTERSAAFRAALFAVPVFLIFVGHVLACLVLFVLLIGFEAGRAVLPDAGSQRRWGGLAAAALMFVPPVVAFIALAPAGENLTDVGGYDPVVRAIGLIGPVLNYLPAVDIATAALLAVALVAGVVTRRFIVHRRMIVPLALLVVMFAVLPDTLFGIPGVGRRMIVPLAFIVVASIDFHEIEVRVERWACVALLALFCLRLSIVATEWGRVRPFYEDVARAIEAVPAGSRLYTVLLQPPGPGLMMPPARYVAALAIVGKNALADGIHQDNGAQIVRYRDGEGGPPLFRAIQRKQNEAAASLEDLLADVPRDRVDMAWLLNPQELPVDPPLDADAVMYRGAYVTLVGVAPPAPSGRPPTAAPAGG